jgi:serine hydrolase
MRTIGLAVSLAIAAAPAFAQAESVAEVKSRGQTIRALLISPADPVGSVILLAGGHGKLDLGPDGRMAWGARNQLVRTRAAYAKAGFVTLVPDIAPDLKTSTDVVERYRFSPPHARDIGALVEHMRRIKPPVVLVATSRGAVSAGNALAHASGAGRPDAVVLTAPMLVSVGTRAPNFQMAIGNNPARAQLPLLVVGHKKDSCKYTLPATIDRFKAWHRGKVDVVLLDGPAGTGEPCEALSAHGFAGIDQQVVDTVANWIKAKNFSRR